MQFWGKVLGSVAGLATGRPIVGLLGLLLGHQFDRGFAERFSGDPSSDGRKTQLPDYFLRALFQSMGHLAKCDGRVSPEEIRAARALMHRLNFSPSQTRTAIRWFEAGKETEFPLLTTVRGFRADASRRPELHSLFVRLLVEVSLSKTTLAQVERSLMWKVSKELNVGRVELAQLEAMLRAQRAFRKSPAGEADASRVTRAYGVLGVDRSSSNAEIKKAYRRLMNKHHPDKIAASQPGAKEVAAAEQRTREIRTAYETLKTRRLIR